MQKIKKIHDSDLYGIFIELGCGTPVSHQLCMEAGASKTIYYAQNPYAKSYSQELFNIKGRLVSQDAVAQILNSIAHPKVNFYYVSSFQVGQDNDISTHGYIGIKYKNNQRIYHVSIHESLHRIQYMNLIGDLGLNLIFREINESHHLDFIDAVYEDYNQISLIETLSFALEQKEDLFIYIKDGKVYRLEHFLRTEKENLIIYKGSFNPIHLGHETIAKKSLDLFPNSELCFSISLDTYGKGTIHIDDLIKRTQYINDIGYPVLIYNRPLYKDMIEILQQKTKKCLIYPLGYDTALKIGKNNINNFKNCKFIIFNRNNEINNSSDWLLDNTQIVEFDCKICSTEIRTKLKNNESIKELVNPKIENEIRKNQA